MTHMEPMQDSYTEKTDLGTLKVYIDMDDLETTQRKLKNFIKIRNFINALQKTAI